jgi:hypothetical protein
MASEGVPALLEALFIYGKAEILLIKRTKHALRLCSKHFKNLVDATVVEVEKSSGDLNLDLSALLNSEWHGLKTLKMKESVLCQNRLTELPSALFVKFPRLETLKIDYFTALKALPEEIGMLSHLKSLKIHCCYSLSALPSSFGKLTALEEIDLCECNLTVESLAPLQHLTGLTSLKICLHKSMKYPDFICTLNALKELQLSSRSVQTLPDALGNLTNLEKYCNKLTTLPESLDDLLWRKARETEESKKMELVNFSHCPNLVLSSETRQALKLLEQNGADIRSPRRY